MNVSKQCTHKSSHKYPKNCIILVPHAQLLSKLRAGSAQNGLGLNLVSFSSARSQPEYNQSTSDFDAILQTALVSIGKLQ